MFLEIEGRRIAYTEAGSSLNPPIIFVHGLTSHRGVWTRTIESLQDRFHCVALDLLGFGDSDKPGDGDYTIPKQAERVLKIADHFGFDKFVIIGHSMGGQISTYLAATLAPQRISKLVSVSGVVTGVLTRYVRAVNMQLVQIGRYVPQAYNLIGSMCAWKWFANFAFRVWFLHPSAIPFDDWAVDRKNAINPSNAISAFEAYRALRNTNLTSSLTGITAPTLALHGIQDSTVPVSDARLIQQYAPTSKLVLFDQCGHFPMYEKFDEYIKPLQEFLE
jgi:pimeloyl-ACP methyl ester carboxylesterase